MKKIGLFLSGLTGLLLLGSGCKTTELAAPKPISWERQSAYLSKVRDPRIFGIGIYSTPAGIQYRGGGRLHSGQGAVLPMTAVSPVRPVVLMKGKSGNDLPVLLDLTATHNWLNFEAAALLKATPIGEKEAQLIPCPDEGIMSCLSQIPKLRLDQLHVEHALALVRLADGSLGPLARGITEPSPKGVIGWSGLKKFEQIRFDYVGGQVLLMIDTPYLPNPARLTATLKLVKHAGVCAVRGTVGGKPGLILIDPAGDFELATGSPAGEGQAVVLSDGLDLTGVLPVTVSEAGTRLGARFLQNYDVTVCPKAGVVYFEKLLSPEE